MFDEFIQYLREETKNIIKNDCLLKNYHEFVKCKYNVMDRFSKKHTGINNLKSKY